MTESSPRHTPKNRGGAYPPPTAAVPHNPEVIPYNLVVLLGPTASGKTRLAVDAATKLGGEIISADSRQVYRGMDIGTGKDLEEYGTIPYHLIDIVEPGYEFNVFEFQQRFYAAFEEIQARTRMPLLCGGTGLYLEAVLSGYLMVEAPLNPVLRARLEPLTHSELQEELLRLKPEQHNSTDLEERERLIRAIEIARAQKHAPPTPALPELRPLVFGLQWARPRLRQRIGERLHQRLQQGMVEEVERLQQQGTSWETLEFYGLEYRFIAQYLQGVLSYSDMVQQLERAIGKFAKRQETWFRRMEKRGTTIHWLDPEDAPLAQLLHICGRTSAV
ncbi:MAG: tRNA (adenosine(37)-N6)-dimethylallyltransferase MiaA [Desulfuromonadaceae bacterium]|nr:tRNA (adenosine(37)-N6)-dimethylallyltransferase MiaA [Desulfuromonadaceae bacterium]